MKKFLVLLLSAMLVLSTVTLPATAAGIDDNLVFDLDFSNYDANGTGAKGLVNAAGSTTTFSAVQGVTTGTANGISYIETGADSDSVSEIRFVDTAFNTQVTNSLPVTIETWVYEPSSAASARQFMLSYNALYFESGIYQGSKYFKGGTVSQVNYPSIYDSWKHIVLVRKIVNGKLAYTAYQNGVQANSVTTADNDPARDCTDAIFNISNSNHASGRKDLNFIGKYSTFKLYNGEITEAEVVAKYNATCEAFGLSQVTGGGNTPGGGTGNTPGDNTGGTGNTPGDNTGGTPGDNTGGTTQGLVFGIDVSNYDANGTGAKGITNIGSDNTATFDTVTGFTKGTVAQNASGNTVSYLDTNGYESALVAQVPALNSANEYSFETWIVDEHDTTDTSVANKMNFLFMFSSGKTSGSDFHLMRMNAANYSFRYSGGGTAAVPREENVWNHLVFTRKKDGTKTIFTVYKNGELILSRNDGAASTADMSNGWLHISGYVYGGAQYGFKGKIATFNVYNKVLTENEVLSKFNSSSMDFFTLPEQMGLTSVSVPEGSIQTAAGSLTIEFDNFIKKETVSEITFTNADGTEITGGVTVEAEAGDYTKKVIVTYPKLTVDASYKLTIGAGVKSLNDVAYTGQNEFLYTGAPNVIINEDFSSYEVGAAPQIPGFTFGSSCTTSIDGLNNSTADFTIEETEAGDKYLVGICNTGLATSLNYKFSPTVKGKTIAIELGVRSYLKGGAGAGTANARNILNFNGVLFGHNNTDSTHVKVGAKDGARADDGFYYVKVIASPGANGKYTFDCYASPDDASPKTYDAYTDTFNNDELKYVMLAHVYPGSDATALGKSGFAITSVKMYYVEVPQIVGGTSGALSKTDDTLEIWFDSDMDVASVENAKYTLKNSDGTKEVPVKFVRYDEQTRKAYVLVEENLEPEVTYSLSAEGTLSADGIAVQGKDIYTVSLAESPNKPQSATITAPAVGATSVSALINLPSGAQVTYILTVFDANGRIKVAKKDTISGTVNSVSLSVANGLAAGDVAKLLVWEAAGSGFVPLYAQPITITCN